MALPPRGVAAALALGPERVAGAVLALGDEALGAGAGAGSLSVLDWVAHAASVATTNRAKEVFMLKLPLLVRAFIMLQNIFGQI